METKTDTSVIIGNEDKIKALAIPTLEELALKVPESTEINTDLQMPNDIPLEQTKLQETAGYTEGSKAEKDDTEIPFFTNHALNHHQMKKLNIKKYATKAVLDIFISQYLDTEYVKISDKYEKHFCVKDGFVFRNIYICGTIVAIQSLKFQPKDRMLLSVDDGTGVMDCYLDTDPYFEQIAPQVEAKVRDLKESVALDGPTDIMKSTLRMLLNAQDSINIFTYYKQFQLGDTVKLLGTLNEYKDKRSCFISVIIKDDTSTITHLEQVDELYQTYMKKCKLVPK